ncbi:MAG: DMT family transporter, partial [Nitrospinota bacterium]
MPLLLATATAALVGFNVLLARIGLAHISALHGATLVTAINVLLFWPLVWASGELAEGLGKPVLWFVAGGTFVPTATRVLYYTGLQRVGAPRTAAVYAVYPLFAAALAITLLGERPTSLVLLGTVSVVCGVALIPLEKATGRWRRRDLAFPLLSAFSGAAGYTCMKQGLLLLPRPLLAAAVSTSTSLFLTSILAGALEGLPARRPQRGALLCFALSGTINTLGYVTAFTALAWGDQTVVIPIMSASPLFVAAMSPLFRGRTERASRAVWAGSLLVVAGA